MVYVPTEQRKVFGCHATSEHLLPNLLVFRKNNTSPAANETKDIFCCLFADTDAQRNDKNNVGTMYITYIKVSIIKQ